MRLKISVAFILTMTLFSVSKAQLSEIKGYPIVGERCPDFVLTDVHYYGQRKLSLDDLKGKHVILDFWAKDCISCIKSFPKWDSLQDEFRDKLQVILVGKYDSGHNKGIKDIYEKYRIKLNLNLVVAYDSVLFEPPFKVERAGVPWYVWIDEKGIVKAVTGASDINESNIKLFLAGKKFNFFDLSYLSLSRTRSNYNRDKPLFIYNNGACDTCFLYRSLLGNWKPGMSIDGSTDIDFFTKRKRFLPKYEVVCASLEDLFVTAFTGKRWLEESFYFKVELSDNVDLELFKTDMATGKGFYSYSLIVPTEKADRKRLMKIMQNDLMNYWGYTAEIIEKKMPCLSLKVIDNEKFNKLKTDTGGRYINRTDVYLFEYENGQIDEVANALKIYTQEGQLRIFNETGYNGKVSLKFEALMTSLEDVRKGIKKYGLDIVKDNKKMKVLKILKYEMN